MTAAVLQNINQNIISTHRSTGLIQSGSLYLELLTAEDTGCH